MTKFLKRFFDDTAATGFAIFSMFFGAGNVVYPLVIGRYAGDKNIYAVTGFLLTAVGVPLLGLTAMVLFAGDYKAFFKRLGKIPGMFIITMSMALIGPLAAIPRCVALSYSTMEGFFPGLKLLYFSIAACVLIYILASNKCNVVDLLGRILSPVLLVSLLVIIVKGFISGPVASSVYGLKRVFFMEGLIEGYNTMDIFAGFFFAGVIIAGLRCRTNSSSEASIVRKTVTSGLFGVSLLGAIYAGFSYVSSFYSVHLAAVESDALISAVSFYTLGSYASIIACLAVSLACLTTAIALSVVFSDFVRTELFKNRVGYKSTLLMSMAVAFAMSNIGFSGIVRLVAPILAICYPALIVLAIFNIAHKMWGVKIVKMPVFLTFAAVVLHKTIQYFG